MTSLFRKKIILFTLLTLFSVFLLYEIYAYFIPDKVLFSKIRVFLFLLTALLLFLYWVLEILSWSQIKKEKNYQIQKVKTDLDQKQQALTEERDRWATLFQTMQEGVLVFNEEGEILFFNPAIGRIFSLSKADQKKPLLEVIRNADLQLLVERSLAGEKLFGEELRVVQEGKERFFKVQATPWVHQGRSQGAILAVYEITEVKQLERVRSDFVANVSHELKTPLTSIQGFVETLLDSDLEDKKQTRKFLEILEANTRRLNRLVKELLRLSQLEANQYILHPEEIRVSDLFEELGKLYHSSALKKQINLQTKIDPADANIFADKNGVLQILSNLLSNAIKYSPKGSKIDLIYEATEDQGMFEVKDTGVGISPSQLERIFERFYRVDRSRSREEGGTGLGLAIVKHLVQLLGGEIQVESEEGVGSKFVFRIPKISLSS